MTLSCTNVCVSDVCLFPKGHTQWQRKKIDFSDTEIYELVFIRVDISSY